MSKVSLHSYLFARGRGGHILPIPRTMNKSRAIITDYVETTSSEPAPLPAANAFRTSGFLPPMSQRKRISADLNYSRGDPLVLLDGFSTSKTLISLNLMVVVIK